VKRRTWALPLALPIAGVIIGVLVASLAPSDHEARAIVESRAGSAWESIAAQEHHYVVILGSTPPPLPLEDGVTLHTDRRAADDPFFDVIVRSKDGDVARRTRERVLMWMAQDSLATNREVDEIDFDTWTDALGLVIADFTRAEAEASSTPDDAEARREADRLVARIDELRARVEDADLRLARRIPTVDTIALSEGRTGPTSGSAALIGGVSGLAVGAFGPVISRRRTTSG